MVGGQWNIGGFITYLGVPFFVLSLLSSLLASRLSPKGELKNKSKSTKQGLGLTRITSYYYRNLLISPYSPDLLQTGTGVGDRERIQIGMGNSG
ncbi:hypothetical protein F4774DRAFT_295900 [Daldinia eschscholtzii]|nr:hypothetical protein F4774DRAFT_295900 [Daldinia eschscholtzii]